MNSHGLSWLVLPWRQSRVTEPRGSGPVCGCFSSGQRPVNCVRWSARRGIGSTESSQFTVSGSSCSMSMLVMRSSMSTRPPSARLSRTSSSTRLTASLACTSSSWPLCATCVSTVVQRTNTGAVPRYASSPERPAKASAPCGSSDGRSAASGFSAGGVTLSVIASSAESSPSALGTPKSRPSIPHLRHFILRRLEHDGHAVAAQHHMIPVIKHRCLLPWWVHQSV